MSGIAPKPKFDKIEGPQKTIKVKSKSGSSSAVHKTLATAGTGKQVNEGQAAKAVAISDNKKKGYQNQLNAITFSKKQQINAISKGKEAVLQQINANTAAKKEAKKASERPKIEEGLKKKYNKKANNINKQTKKVIAKAERQYRKELSKITVKGAERGTAIAELGKALQNRKAAISKEATNKKNLLESTKEQNFDERLQTVLKKINDEGVKSKKKAEDPYLKQIG